MDVAEVGRLFANTDEGADIADVGGKLRNVVPIREEMKRLPDFARLSPQERSAFDEIAQALKTHDELTHSIAPEAKIRSDAKPDGRSGDTESSGDQEVTDDAWGEYSTDPNDPYFLASLPEDDDNYPLATIVLSENENADAGSDGAVQDRSRPDDAARDKRLRLLWTRALE